MRADELVEGRFGVQHHRPELAAHLDTGLLEELRVDPRRGVSELLQAERVRQALRRVDV